MFIHILVLSWQLIALLCSCMQESSGNHKSSIRGWVLRASAPADYEIGIDHRTAMAGAVADAPVNLKFEE